MQRAYLAFRVLIPAFWLQLLLLFVPPAPPVITAPSGVPPLPFVKLAVGLPLLPHSVPCATRVHFLQPSLQPQPPRARPVLQATSAPNPGAAARRHVLQGRTTPRPEASFQQTAPPVLQGRTVPRPETQPAPPVLQGRTTPRPEAPLHRTAPYALRACIALHQAALIRVAAPSISFPQGSALPAPLSVKLALDRPSPSLARACVRAPRHPQAATSCCTGHSSSSLVSLRLPALCWLSSLCDRATRFPFDRFTRAFAFTLRALSRIRC